MQTKNRKINKEELELWKLVTKNDKVIGKYTTKVEETRIKKKINPISKVKKKIVKIEKKKLITLRKIFKLIKE